MIVTEEEAKTKQCCHWLNNKFPHQDSRCIASQCMAWRWKDGDDTECLNLDTGAIELPKGFCGLAGKVEA